MPDESSLLGNGLWYGPWTMCQQACWFPQEWQYVHPKWWLEPRICQYDTQNYSMVFWHAETLVVKNNDQLATGGTAQKQDRDITIIQPQGARNKVSLNNIIQLEPCVSAITCDRNLKWQTGRTGTQDTTGNCKSTRNTHTCWSHSHHVYCTVQTPQMQHHLHLTCSIQTCSYSEWQCCPSCHGTQRRLPGHLHF